MKMAYFKQLKVGGFDDNFSYIIGDENTKEVFAIDPENLEMINKIIKKDELILNGVILTHGHFDHEGVSPEICEEYKVHAYLHFDDINLLKKENKRLVDLTKIKFLKTGDLKIEIIHTPGHSNGSVCLKAENKLLTGDTLFVGTHGRLDLEESNKVKFRDSIAKLKKLPKNLEIWPGHDYGKKASSTLEEEIKNNPAFL